MKILFVEITPDANLEKALLTGGFKVESHKKIVPSQNLESFDVLITPLKALDELSKYNTIKEKYPKTWLILVIDAKRLDNTTWQTAILNSSAKNDILLHETWEQNLWFSLQRAAEHKNLVDAIEGLNLQIKSLKNHYDELSVTSGKLIQQFEKDVGIATNIQRSLLPKHSPKIPGVSLSIKYIPASGLGGDYYDIFEFGDRKRYGVLIADSQTHGMAAALLSVLLKVRIEEMKDRFPNSNSFVEFLNREIRNFHEKDLASLSLVYGILDRSTLTFQFTVAGSLHPVLWRSGKVVDIPPLNNPPLGGMVEFTFRENTLTLQPADLLILHTDGLEAPLTHGKSGKSALDKIVQILAKKDPSPDPLEVQVELMGLIDRYIDKHPLADDLTILHFAIDARTLYVARGK